LGKLRQGAPQPGIHHCVNNGASSGLGFGHHILDLFLVTYAGQGDDWHLAFRELGQHCVNPDALKTGAP
jgi:hypothetical protein